MSFEKWLAQVLKDEGGYANNPLDAGGETFQGISRKNWPKWEGWQLIDEAKKRGFKTASQINAYFKNHTIMNQLVADFYRVNFYDVVK